MPNETIQVVLIDDEAQSRNTLRVLLSEYCPQVKIIGEADGVLAGFKLLQRESPDAVFLDVQMNDGTGFDLLRKFNPPSFRVIFTTAFDEFALKAFKFNAIDYLVKPIDVDELIRAVDKIKPNVEQPQADERIKNLLTSSENREFEKIAISSSEGLHFITLKDIVRLGSDANYTTFYLASGEKITVAKSLKNFDLLLIPTGDFFRPHQSHIINLHHVKGFLREDGGSLQMKDGSKIPVARGKKDELMETMKNLFLQ